MKRVNEVYSERKAFAPLSSKSFPVCADPFAIRRQNNLTAISPPRCISDPIKLLKTTVCSDVFSGNDKRTSGFMDHPFDPKNLLTEYDPASLMRIQMGAFINDIVRNQVNYTKQHNREPCQVNCK